LAASTLTGTLQDYLKAIYCLEREAGGVTATRLAETLGVSPPSVTSMMRKLASRRLVGYAPYGAISLTAAGEREALELVRHHRLLETYLHKALGFGLDRLHAEADRIEHAMSEELEEKIDSFLGHPSFDPHGSPIPDSQGRIPSRFLEPLAALGPGEGGVVGQVTTRDAETLRHLEAIGLVPGAAVTVRPTDLQSGTLRLRIAGTTTVVIGSTIAAQVLVSRTGGME
jgi:DtxR family transcriptional regulator, Mn-dependent transcriptional regulator